MIQSTHSLTEQHLPGKHMWTSESLATELQILSPIFICKAQLKFLTTLVLQIVFLQKPPRNSTRNKLQEHLVQGVNQKRHGALTKIVETLHPYPVLRPAAMCSSSQTTSKQILQTWQCFGSFFFFKNLANISYGSSVSVTLTHWSIWSMFQLVFWTLCLLLFPCIIMFIWNDFIVLLI